MLPARHRLRTGAEFTAVTRRPGGARAGSRLLVVHANQTDSRAARPPRIGFVVSKNVGGAVTRSRVKRRLRASMAPLLTTVPDGVDLVVRAQAPAAAATSAELAPELERLVNAALGRIRVEVASP